MGNLHQVTYPNAPIIEAIVEFRFQNPIDQTGFDKLSAALSKILPDERLAPHIDIVIDIGTNGFRKEEVKGVIRSIPDQTKLVVIRPLIIACSVQAPYKDYEDFKRFVFQVWDIATKASGFRNLQRVGMRYINRIDIPYDDEMKADYEEYLNLRINLTENFPSITSYGLNFTFQITEIDGEARIISNVTNDIVINHASFFLDIDVGKAQSVPQKRSELVEMIDKMRLIKNGLFEQFITDKARALFHVQ